MQSAVGILSKYKRPVWARIQKYLGSQKYHPLFVPGARYKNLVNKHSQIVNEYPQRQGKYLRPTLLILCAKAMGAKQSATINTAAAMQLSEDWLLIHDDFEDHSRERRGKPTLHLMYGDELAVNAGDSLHLIMWKVLQDNRKVLGEQKSFALMDEFSQALGRTALGQTAELLLANDKQIKFRSEDYFFIIDGKTSYYTIVLPLRLGAIIAGANLRQLNELTKFGKLLGRSFQITDDVLDLTGDFAGLKKQQGNDIYEGKRTIILSHLVENANKKDKARIEKIMFKPRDKKSKGEVEFILGKMQEYGSINHARELAAQFNKKALMSLENNLEFLEGPARKELEMVTRFIVTRNH